MSNSPISIGRLKPALWAVAIVFICMSLLRAVVRPSELYTQPRSFAEELDWWVTVDFTTGHEVPRSHNTPNVSTWDAAWVKDVLPISKAVFALNCVWLAVWFAVRWVVFAVSFAVGLGVMVILLRKVDWPAVFGVVVGALWWFLHWVAGIVRVAAQELSSYLARIGENLTTVTGDFARELVRAGKDFLTPKRVLGKILEWVAPVQNVDFGRLDNLLAWVEERLEPGKRYLIGKPIRITEVSLSEDHKTPVVPEAVTEEAEYEDDEIWVEDFGPVIQLGLGLARPLELPEIQHVVEPGVTQEIVEQEVIRVFKRRPWSRQTIFTANSSKDIEGLPLYVYPPRSKWFWLWRAEGVLKGLRKILPRFRVIKHFRVSRTPCRRVSVIPRSRLRMRKKTSSVPHALPPAPGPAMDQSVSEVRGELEVYSPCDKSSVDVPVVVEEARAYIEPVIVEEKEEHQPQVFVQEGEVFQQADRQAMEPIPEPAPKANINEAWENNQGVGLAAGPSRDVPVTSEEVQASLGPAIAEGEKECPPQESMQKEAETQQPDLATPALTHEPALKASINEPWENIKAVDLAGGLLKDVPTVVMEAGGSLNVTVTVEEVQASLGPAITEGEKECPPQESMQQEAEIQQPDLAAPALTHEPAPKASINEVWENIQAVDLATGPMRDVSAAAMAVGSWNVAVTTGEVQVSLGPAITEGEKECPPQESMQQEAEIQPPGLAAPAIAQEPAPKENINEAWANLQDVGLATGPLRDVPMMDMNALDSWNVPVSVEEVQMSLEPAIAEEAEGLIKHRTAEGSGEHHLQAFWQQEELIQRTVPPVVAVDDEQVQEANLDTLWEELLEAGLVTERLVDAPQVGVSATDPWGVPATVEEVVRPADPQAMVLAQEPVPVPQVDINELWANCLAAGLVTEPLGGAPNVAMNITDPQSVPVTMEEAQPLLAPTMPQGSEEFHPQPFLQQEGAIHRARSQAIALSQGTVPRASLDDLWANLQAAGHAAEQSGNGQRGKVSGLDATYSQRRSPPYDNPIADLTGYPVPGSGNGGLVPRAFTLPAQEQAPVSSLPAEVKTEGVGPVKSGRRVAPAFLFGDPYDTEEEIAPPVTSTFNFTPPVQKRGEAPATMLSTGGNGGQAHLTKPGEESSGSETDEEEKIYWADSMPGKLRTLHGHYSQAPEAQTSSDSETDEEEKIYWADNMPGKLRTLHGHYSGTPRAQAPKQYVLVSEDSSSDVSEYELYELFNKECGNNEEAKEDKQAPGEEWGGGDSNKVKCANSMPTHFSAC
ncbi:hypothetical protein HOY80DRAFT_1139030 [Tuber brumale]|nr:hypothetical protein HOY80DRAFT_1139030 [Tuber brumale]